MELCTHAGRLPHSYFKDINMPTYTLPYKQAKGRSSSAKAQASR